MLHTTFIHRCTAALVAGLFALGLFALPVLAQTSAEQAIRTMLEQRDRELKQAVEPLIDNPKGATAAQRQRVEDLINGVIHFEEMARQALGPFWSDLTPAQRTEFVDVFGQIVRAQSLGDLEVYNSTVTYETIDVVGDSAYVSTTTVYQDKPVKVEYYLGEHDGDWYVHNMVLDDVGTVEGYAKSFQAVIRKKGFDALMTSLNKKLEKIQGA